MSTRLRNNLRTSTRVSLRRVLVRTAVAAGVTGILVSAGFFLYNNLGTSKDSLAVPVVGFAGGTYYIGGSGSTPSPGCQYVDLTAAAQAINNNSITGPVTFVLTSTYSAAQENSFPVTFTGITGTSDVNTVTIKPNTGVNATISGSGSAVLRFNAVKYFIIDGSNNGSNSQNLTIKNTGTTHNTAAIWLSSQGASQGVENFTLRNTIVSHNSNTTYNRHTFGIYIGGTTLSNGYDEANLSKDSKNITIENCQIYKALWGIWGAGKKNNKIDNLIIRNNVIGSDVATDYIGYVGIDLTNATNTLIRNNIVKNVRSAVGNTSYGSVTGIWTGGLYNSSIVSNTITGIKYTGTGNFGGVGIDYSLLENNQNANMVIANNVICDIGGRGNVDLYYGNAGLRISPNGYTLTGFKIYFNSINLTGTQAKSYAMSAAIAVTGSGIVSALDVRNNVMSNTMTHSGSGRYGYAFYNDFESGIFSDINFNLYYVNSSYGNVGYMYYYDMVTFDDWKDATGKDSRSMCGNPGFTSATDLHPVTASADAWLLSGKATQIVDINYDRDGSARSVSPSLGIPDIGAYEFEIDPAVVPVNTTQIGTVANGATTEYQFAKQTVSAITWHGSSLPTIVMKYYTNTVPPDVTVGNSSFSYWEITPSGGSNYTYDITFSYDPSMIGTIGSENDIIIAKSHAGGPWENLETSVVDQAAKTVTVTGLQGFSRFIFTDRKSPLPISLISFEARLSGTRVLLSWATASETNNDFFTIERSADARNFKPIATLKGAGNSNSVIRYQQYDASPLQGVSYYRLKQTDFDGKYSYSPIASVNTGGDESSGNLEISSYGPNPFSSYFDLRFICETEGTVSINIYSTGGQLMFSDQMGAQVGENLYTFNDFMGLPRGIYLVNIMIDKKKSKFVKMLKE